MEEMNVDDLLVLPYHEDLFAKDIKGYDFFYAQSRRGPYNVAEQLKERLSLEQPIKIFKLKYSNDKTLSLSVIQVKAGE